MIYYQIGAILIVVIFAAIGAFRGIARTVLNIVGVAVNAALSYLIATPLAQGIYDTFLKQSIITQTQQIIAENGVNFVVDSVTNALPDWLSGAIGITNSITGQDLAEIAKGYELSDTQTLSMAESIEQAVGQVAVSVLSILLVIVLFFIIMIFIKLLIRLILKATNYPVLKTLDRVLGAVLGTVEGCGIVILICLLFNIKLFS